jgi:bifunctional non-homologous end joining protein LigD
VTWDEVGRAAKRKDRAALTFVAENVVRRVQRLGDLFEPVLKVRQRLPAM